MDVRAAKLALARKKLKDHQEKKHQETSYTDQNHSNNIVDFNCQEDYKIHTTENVQPTDQLPKIGNNYQPNTLPEAEEFYDNSNMNTLELKPTGSVLHYHTSDIDVTATEILISNERNLELQINTLQAKLMELETRLTTTTQEYETSCGKVISLETDLKNIEYKYQAVTEQLMNKDTTIKELTELKSSLIDQNSNLKEQLEFTKSILTAKEAENDSLHGHLFNMQNQLDATQLQLQQLTSGANSHMSEDTTKSLKHENEGLIQKISNLEQQLKIQIKDYQQLNNHYEHYVSDLINQLKQAMKKNEEFTREIQSLSNRENSLIEQIGEMEIRLQNYKSSSENNVKEQNRIVDISAIEEMRDSHEKVQQNLHDLSVKYAELQKLYADSRAEIEKLTCSKEILSEESNESVSLLKLNADIASDKIAAQRATEQNKKLKEDIQRLEDAFVKMTKDKLELTEKITAEKFLNRELTIKLAEIDEKANDMQKTLKAKDEEMIRLQTSYRVIEEKYNEIAENLKHLNGNLDPQEETDSENKESYMNKENNKHVTSCYNHECQGHDVTLECNNDDENSAIPKADAMVKLQERFLKIMDEVADLSDEKHRLEHIITQLQNETDTICEYVALYQQQRCLLKKRDEERSAQMKMFQSECTRLQNQLNELTRILTRFAEDKELSSYFQVETKHEDIQNVMKLLSKLKTNSLIDPEKSIKFNDFYPCSCCSGQLIEV